MHVQHTRWHTLTGLIDRIKYKDWFLDIGPMGTGYYIQAELSETDERGYRWKGRKWYISNHATDAEVVSTAFRAVLTAEEHETRESFLFDGLPIFGPHQSLEALKHSASQKEDSRA